MFDWDRKYFALLKSIPVRVFWNRLIDQLYLLSKLCFQISGFLCTQSTSLNKRPTAEKLFFEYILTVFLFSVFLKHSHDTLYERDTIK